MITIKAVPTRTPIPMVDINLSRDCESEKDSGREPARNELQRRQTSPANSNNLYLYSRNGHDRAQSEQHKQTVQHLQGVLNGFISVQRDPVAATGLTINKQWSRHDLDRLP